jgi:hypothetical protein
VPDLWTDLLGCLDLHIEDGACGFTGLSAPTAGCAFATPTNRSTHDRPQSSPWRKSVRISHKPGDSENSILVEEEF